MTKAITKFAGDYRFLSNFWMAPTEYDGDLYPTSENAYQAAKLSMRSQRAPFRSYSPSEAKRYGRVIACRAGWNLMKVAVMEQVVSDKFVRNGDLGRKLVATGDAELVEGNNWGDTFWGSVLGQGENQLGKILMNLRAELAAL